LENDTGWPSQESGRPAAGWVHPPRWHWTIGNHQTDPVRHNKHLNRHHNVNISAAWLPSRRQTRTLCYIILLMIILRVVYCCVLIYCVYYVV
jgi:t-SNARE complex subunit (syntaxin)